MQVLPTIDKSIAVLRNLPTGFSSQATQEIEQVTNLPWQRNAYSDYTSQGYEVVSLFNKDGNSTNTIIEDGRSNFKLVPKAANE